MGAMRTLNPRAPEFFPNYYLRTQGIAITHLSSWITYPDQQQYVDAVLLSPNQHPPLSCYYNSPCPDLVPAYSIYEPNEAHLVSEVAQVAYSGGETSSNNTCGRARGSEEKGEVYRSTKTARRFGGDGTPVSGSSISGREGRFRKEKLGGTKQRQVRGNVYVRSCRSSRRNHPVVPVQPDVEKTTVMIRNIPNRYTRELLMEFLDRHCKAENQKAAMETCGSMELKSCSETAFDFLYLPMDFEKGANKGYAFVNFTNPGAVWRFYLAAHNQAWELFQSRKTREIAIARLQGKGELVRHFQKTYFECESDDYLPICFSPPRDGSGAMVSQKTIGNRIGKGSSV